MLIPYFKDAVWTADIQYQPLLAENKKSKMNNRDLMEVGKMAAEGQRKKKLQRRGQEQDHYHSVDR